MQPQRSTIGLVARYLAWREADVAFLGCGDEDLKISQIWSSFCELLITNLLRRNGWADFTHPEKPPATKTARVPSIIALLKRWWCRHRLRIFFGCKFHRWRFIKADLSCPSHSLTLFAVFHFGVKIKGGGTSWANDELLFLSFSFL